MKNELDYRQISNMNKEDVFTLFETGEQGLNNKESLKRLETYGENIATNRKKKTPLFFIFEALKDKKVLMLKGDALHSYFESNSKAKIKEYDELIEPEKRKKDRRWRSFLMLSTCFKLGKRFCICSLNFSSPASFWYIDQLESI